MKKILLIGNSPLANENTKSRPAAGLRTYMFLKGLEFGDFDVRTVCVGMRECYGGGNDRRLDHNDFDEQVDSRFRGNDRGKGNDWEHRLAHQDSGEVIFKDDPCLLSKIQKIHNEYSPDIVIGVNTFPSYIASRLKTEAPFWADLNGWIMAEGQAQAYKKDTNDYLPHYLGIQKSILKRADKFSTVSKAQSYCLYGELAFLGRLNKETFDYDFTISIENGTEWFNNEKETFEKEYNGKMFDKLPNDAFVAVWIGGYNTWVDEITLFKGLEKAMQKCKKLYYVSTGGGIKGLDNKTFANFKKMVDKSEFKNRFVFLGWVETNDIPYIYQKADLGLNVDRQCVETKTGARNRINEMMKFGIPVISTLGSEISYEMNKLGAGIGVESGNYKNLANSICEIYNNGSGKMGFNGQKYICEKCNYKTLIKPVRNWIELAKKAPDSKISVGINKTVSIKTAIRYFRENGIKKFIKKVWQIFNF